MSVIPADTGRSAPIRRRLRRIVSLIAIRAILHGLPSGAHALGGFLCEYDTKTVDILRNKHYTVNTIRLYTKS